MARFTPRMTTFIIEQRGLHVEADWAFHFIQFCSVF